MNTDTDHTHGTKKRAMTATFAIMGSRILGLVREQVFAFFFGAGMALDAFVVAFRIPNLLRDLAAEGALSQSFITIFSQKIARGENKRAYTLANKLTTLVIIVMLVITVLGEIFAPQIVAAVARGFTADKDKFDLTVRLMRILFPYILFVSLAALLMGMLNSQKKFFIPFSASTFCNFISIAVGLLCAYLLAPNYISMTAQRIFLGNPLTITDGLAIANAITGMAWGSLLGGLGQYLFQLPSLFKLGYRPGLNFKFKDSELAQILKLTGPAIIGGSAVQVNVLVNTWFASFLNEGSVSYLNFAFRFMQFPLGIFGVAIAAASAPVLAQMIAQNRHGDFLQSIRSALKLSFFFSIPSAIGLIIMGQDIIALIYEHGQFDLYDTMQTGYALMAYSFGIASYSIIKIYQPAYLAFHNAKTPMKIALFSIVVNVSINAFFIFVLHLSHWALALGTAIVAITNLALLAFFFKKHVGGVWSRDVFLTLVKTVVAGVVMGVVVWLVQVTLQPLCVERTLAGKLLLVFVPMLAAIPVYFCVAYFFKVSDARYFIDRIKNRLFA
ncbi:MAG: murein biosynthesis integral membrane protein MurJ [Deltaproteobacteria bacterium]|nr:murein biosynthesis integral membrane protein MurJ [Deltaproteobacteria bacterium]